MRTVDQGAVNAGDGTDIGAFEVQNSLFNFTGFFKPVDNLPTVNIVNAGKAVPMKFWLDGYHGLNIFASGHSIPAPVVCDTDESGITVEETVTSGRSSLSYDQTTDQYSYVWKTNKARKGPCRMFDVKLSDGSEHTPSSVLNKLTCVAGREKKDVHRVCGERLFSLQEGS